MHPCRTVFFVNEINDFFRRINDVKIECSFVPTMGISSALSVCKTKYNRKSIKETLGTLAAELGGKVYLFDRNVVLVCCLPN